jgi:hypothetical protein
MKVQHGLPSAATEVVPVRSDRFGPHKSAWDRLNFFLRARRSEKSVWRVVVVACRNTARSGVTVIPLREKLLPPGSEGGSPRAIFGRAFQNAETYPADTVVFLKAFTSAKSRLQQRHEVLKILGAVANGRSVSVHPQKRVECQGIRSGSYPFDVRIPKHGVDARNALAVLVGG